MTTPTPRPAVADETLFRPDWTKAARDTSGVLALDKNENLDPLYHAVIEQVMAGIPVRAALEYPECAPYYHELAAYLGVGADNLLFTHGSDGAIRLVFEAFVSPGDKVLQTDPSFAMYPIYTRMYGGRVAALEYHPSDAGPVLTCDHICERLAEEKARLLCLPNPDSPSGTIFPAAEIKRIVEAADAVGTVVLIDEAYYPFSDVTVMPLIADHDNLVVTQTFAKAWGLAGLRIGFAAAHPSMAKVLHKVRPMYEVGTVALAAVSGVLKHADAMTASAARANAGKRHFIDRMAASGIRTLDCSGNFVHALFGERGEAVFAALDGKVLYKKSFGHPSLAGLSRFTTAPVEVMDQLADLIDSAL